jgi:hypothetical protein
MHNNVPYMWNPNMYWKCTRISWLQWIAFLVGANFVMFFMNIYEAQKPGLISKIFREYGKGETAWEVLIRGLSPLIIFYRFHSSVCFVEILRKSYPVSINAQSSSGYVSIRN